VEPAFATEGVLPDPVYWEDRLGFPVIVVVMAVAPAASPVLIAGTVGGPDGLHEPVPPEEAYPAAPLSFPLMKYWLELGRGEKEALGPSNPKAPPGGVKLRPAISYWPIRRLPCGVTPNETAT